MQYFVQKRVLQINLRKNFFLTVRNHAAHVKSPSGFSFRCIKLKKYYSNVDFIKSRIPVQKSCRPCQRPVSPPCPSWCSRSVCSSPSPPIIKHYKNNNYNRLTFWKIQHEIKNIWVSHYNTAAWHGGSTVAINGYNYQGCGSESRTAWIRVFWGSWIRIRIRVKSWIRLRIKVKKQVCKAQNGAMEDRERSQWRRGG